MRLYRWSDSVRTSLFSWVPGSMPWQLGRVSIYGRVCLCLTPASQCPAWTCESLTNSMQWSVAYKGMYRVIWRQWCSVCNVGGSPSMSLCCSLWWARTVTLISSIKFWVVSRANITKSKFLLVYISLPNHSILKSNSNYLLKHQNKH